MTNQKTDKWYVLLLISADCGLQDFSWKISKAIWPKGFKESFLQNTYEFYHKSPYISALKSENKIKITVRNTVQWLQNKFEKQYNIFFVVKLKLNADKIWKTCNCGENWKVALKLFRYTIWYFKLCKSIDSIILSLLIRMQHCVHTSMLAKEIPNEHWEFFQYQVHRLTYRMSHRII